LLKRISAVTLILLALVVWWSTPPKLGDEYPGYREPAAALETALAAEEARIDAEFGLIAGTEKRIVWHGEPGRPSDYAVVYLHGFSASRQEIAPVPSMVAEALDANLFETRLSGHGLSQGALVEVRAEDWLTDGAEALAIGRRLGERLVVIGTSTGATLVLALAGRDDFEAIDTLVMLSPNHGPHDPASVWLTRPLGPLIARALVGEYREWQPANDAQALYWTTRYPTAALVEMMRLVDRANAMTAVAQVPKALLLYSPEDRVVSVDKLLAAFDTLPAASKAAHAMPADSDPGRHVLGGDVLSPASNAELTERIVNFVRGEAPTEAPPAPPPAH